MVDVEQLVDPELEGLLRELGSRPRSVFLRTSRKEAMRVLRSRTTQGVGAMAVPDALERELVTAHRDELAEILKEACRTKLLEGERERLFVMRYRTAHERVDPVSVRVSGARFHRLSELGLPEPGEMAVTAILDALDPRRTESVSVLDLAALGQQLQPGDSWRVMSAMSLLALGRELEARDLSTTVLYGWPKTEDALRSLEVTAIHEWLSGHPASALEIQEQACVLKADYPVGQANRLRYALLSLREESAMDASSRLEELLDPEHPFVREANETNRARWGSGELAPSREAYRFARHLQARMGPVGRRLTSALE